MIDVIAVYGSPHSGKGAVSLAIAASLAAKKKETIVLSGDRVTPMLKVYAPKEEIPQSLSIGGLLMDADLTEKTVTERIVLHPKSRYLGFMGMASFENITTYDVHFNAERIQSLFSILYRYVDYLIVDCSCNILNDDIARHGLENATVMLELLTPDMQGLEFWRSMQPILKDDRFSQARRVPVINPAKPISPVREVQEVGKAVLGEIKYVLPYSHEVEDRMMCGRLIKWLGRREGIAFENQLERLVKFEILKKGLGITDGRTKKSQ